MKKIVSLLLAVMMVIGMMTFTATASTDTLLTASVTEDSLTAGALSNSRDGYKNVYMATQYNKFNGTTDVTVVQDGTNNIFQIGGYSSTSVPNTLYYLLSDGGYFSSEMSRFTAKVNLPSVGVDGVTNLFAPSNSWSAVYSPYTFGVQLKNGGAYYYDADTGIYVPFIEDNTMTAETWYTVEAIMDSRERISDGSKTYMNAFVYNADGVLVGTSGWQYVSSDTSDSSYYGWLATSINARGYAEGTVVSVDEFNVYTLSDLPSYSVAVGEPTTNKYIATTSTYTNTYRTVGEWFTTATSEANALISSTSTNKVIRVEMSARFPKLPESSSYTFTLLSFNNALQYVTNGKEFDGTVRIGENGLEVRSYNSSTGLYDTVITLSNGATTYTINANEWYNFVWDVDFTDFESPVAKLAVKDASGNVLVSTPSFYNAAPLLTNKWYQSMIIYAGITHNTRTMHLDNTRVYAAQTVTELDNPDKITIGIDDDFEVYDNELYAVGASYKTLVESDKVSHKGKAVNGLQTTHAIAAETVPAFKNGTEFKTTNPVKLTFVYDNPVPASNINTTNIELYADSVKMTSGYTVTAGELDGNNCATTITVNITGLSYGTDYILRLKAGLADYNTAISGGVAADSGLYKDITFSVAEKTPDYEIASALVDTTGATINTSALSKDGTIKGNVTIKNNTDSPMTCYAIIAIYDGTNLADVAMTEEAITVAAGATVTEATPVLTAAKDGLTAKLFVWDNLELMKPLMLPATLPVAE